jgi:hypothetical protein
LLISPFSFWLKTFFILIHRACHALDVNADMQWSASSSHVKWSLQLSDVNEM